MCTKYIKEDIIKFFTLHSSFWKCGVKMYFKFLTAFHCIFRSYTKDTLNYALYRISNSGVCNSYLQMDFYYAVINLGITASPVATNEKFSEKKW